jgi:NAD(P)-dependent dehydrogenase (short-subunit alcohol dehydrogenase family)
MTRAERFGKTALVTGASKRIGRAIALTLADLGMNVAVHYNRSFSDANNLVGTIKKKGVFAWALSGDLRSEDECTALVRDCVSVSRSTLSVLVNNASIFPESTLFGMTLSDLVESLRINAWAPLVLTRAFSSHAARGPGCIVNILDNRITGTDRTHTAYLLSKQILASITRLCALELAPRFRVNGVSPGLILPPAGKTAAYLDKLKSGVPLRMRGSPSDIAAAVEFCVATPFLPGEIITLDGGKHLL